MGQADQLAKYLRQVVKGKMLALYINKLNNNCDGIKQDARANELGTNWEDALDNDIKKAMKDKDIWITHTIQLEDNFSSYKGMMVTLASAELSSPGSWYNEVKQLVEETQFEVSASMQIVEAEDRRRGR